MIAQKIPFPLLLGALLVFFQGVRTAIETLLTPFQRIWIVENLCFLQIFHNRGLSFSLFASSPLALPIAFAGFGGVVLFFLFFRPSKTSRAFFWGTLLLVSGGMNNLGERIFRHAVTDYVGLKLPVMGMLFVNLPDLAIVLGALIIALSSWDESRRLW